LKNRIYIGIFLLVGLAAMAGCRADPGPAESERTTRSVDSDTTSPVQTDISSPDRLRVIVAFGDSLTAGLGVDEAEAYPALLEKKMRAAGYPYRVINAGVSGETTAGGVRRVHYIIQMRPEIVILELGANDGLRGLPLSQTKKNLVGIIQQLQAARIKVVLAGMRLPPNYGMEYTRGFEKIYPELAARYHTTLIPFFLEGVAGRASLNQTDGIHPTAPGYRIVTDHSWAYVKPLLERK